MTGICMYVVHKAIREMNTLNKMYYIIYVKVCFGPKDVFYNENK